jgi:hypothetical protein
MNLSGLTLNLNAEKAYVFFLNEDTSKRFECPKKTQSCGRSRKQTSTDLNAIAVDWVEGKITRKDLVNSLVGFLEHDGN